MFFGVDSLVYRLTGDRSYIVVKHYTSAVLGGGRVPRVDLFVDTPFRIHMRRIVSVHGVGLGRTMHFLGRVSGRRGGCCRFCANRG